MSTHDLCFYDRPLLLSTHYLCFVGNTTSNAVHITYVFMIGHFK